MKEKQVRITLEQVQTVRNVQHFDEPGRMVEHPRTEQVPGPTEYHVVRMTNAVAFDYGVLGAPKLVRVGDVLTEKQAEELNRMQSVEVTITR